MIILFTLIAPLVRLSLQSEDGNIYIRADGSVEPVTASIQRIGDTYSFTSMIEYRSIIVEKCNILLNGSGYELQGSGSGIGFNLTEADNVTIINVEIKGFNEGIYLSHSQNCNISYNNLSNNFNGISLERSRYCTISINNVSNNIKKAIQLEDYSNNNTISGNNLVVNSHGIYLYNSHYCVISNNTSTNNKYGIMLSSSSRCLVSHNNSTDNEYNIRIDYSFENTLKENHMTGNRYNFGIVGESLQQYIHDVDSSNTVNGKPVYYLINQKNLTVTYSVIPDPGYLAIINSTDISVKNSYLSDNWQGLLLAYTTNSRIENVTVHDNKDGFYLYESSNCRVVHNTATYNMYNGILVKGSSNCSILSNSIQGNTRGFDLSYSPNCTLRDNDIVNNAYGIRLDDSSYCTILNNNFIDNDQQASVSDSFFISWDAEPPEGGNYWSDYNGTDINNDAIGETPYVIDEANQDSNPLVGRISEYTITPAENTSEIVIVSNSIISHFNFQITNTSEGIVNFNVTGENGTTGFCRVFIPTALIETPYEVMVNGNVVETTTLPGSNSTHVYLYFAYEHSTSYVEIVPEFQPFLLMPILIIVTAFAFVIIRIKKRGLAL